MNWWLGLAAAFLWVLAVAWYLYISGLYHEWQARRRQRAENPRPPSWLE